MQPYGDHRIVSDLTGPKRLNNFSFNHIAAMQSERDRLYITQYDTGFSVFTLEDPVHPHKSGSYTYPGTQAIAMGAISVRDTMLAAVDFQGISLFNVSDSTNPVKESSITGGGYAVLLRDSLMYAGISQGAHQFSVYSVSDLRSPTVLGSAGFGLISLSSLPMDTSSRYLYMGPIVIDVSNPLSPTGVDSISASGTISGVRAIKDLVYYTDFDGFHILKNKLIMSTGKPPRATPLRFELDNNYPNPFNPTTTIKFKLPAQSHVTLRIYNLLGQPIATLKTGIEQAGYKRVSWNASGYASGIYFYRLDAVSVADPSKSFTSVKKMVLLK